MTALYVFDTSAILAFFWQEPGWERVNEILESGHHSISAVNHAELAGKIVDAEIPPNEVRQIISALRLNVHPFGDEQALATGLMRTATRHLGLSLGDRACLTLARQLGAIAITADRPWTNIDSSLGIQVECIRPVSE